MITHRIAPWAVVAAFLFLLIAPKDAQAVDYVWSGAVSGNWETVTNWTPNGNPGTGDTVTFGDTAVPITVTLTAAHTGLASITVNNTQAGHFNLAGAFNLTATTTTINSGILRISTANILSAQAITVNSGGILESNVANTNFSGVVVNAGGTLRYTADPTNGGTAPTAAVSGNVEFSVTFAATTYGGAGVGIKLANGSTIRNIGTALTFSSPLNLLGAAVTFDTTFCGDTTYAGIINGPGGVLIKGNNIVGQNLTSVFKVVQFNNGNTYTGATVVQSGGLLKANNITATSTSSSVTMQAGGRYEATAANVNLSNLVVDAGGILRLSAAANNSAPTAAIAGQLELNAATIANSATVTLATGASIRASAASTYNGNIQLNGNVFADLTGNAYTLGGILSGGGGLTTFATNFGAPVALTLSNGSNSFTGVLNHNVSTLLLTNVTATASASSVIVQNGARFETNLSNPNLGNLVVNNGGFLRLTNGTQGAMVPPTAPIGGILELNNAAFTGPAGLTLGNGSILKNSVASVISSPLAFSGASTIDTSSGNLTLTGGITGTGDVTAMTTNAANILILSGTGTPTYNLNSLTVGTTANSAVIAAIVRVNNDARLTGLSGGITLLGGTLQVDETAAPTNDLDRIPDTADIILQNGTLTLTAKSAISHTETIGRIIVRNGQGTITTVAVNPVAGTAGDYQLIATELQRLGTGTLVYTRTASTGGEAPNLFLTNLNTTGTPAALVDAQFIPFLTVGATTAAQFTAVYSTANGLVPNTATITTAAAGVWDLPATWVGGVVPGPGADVVVNHAVVLADITGAFPQDKTVRSLTFTAATGVINVIGDSTLNITSGVIAQAAAASPTINSNVNFGTAEGILHHSSASGQNVTINGVIRGSGGINKAGNGGGSFILNNINTYTGFTVLSGGALQYNNDEAFGNTTLALNGGNFFALGSGSRVLDNPIQFGGNVQFSGFPATFTGPVVLTNAAPSYILVINTTTNNQTSAIAGTTFTGAITSASSAGLVKTSTNNPPSSLILSGNSTFSGGFTLNAGSVLVGSDNAFGTGTLTIQGGQIDAFGAARTVTSPANATANFTLGGSFDLTFGNTFDLQANVQVTAQGTAIFSGVVRDNPTNIPRVLTKAGVGTLRLTNSNTFSGGLTWSAGTLQLGNDGAAGVGLLSLNSTTGSLEAFGGPRSVPVITTLGANFIVGGTNDLTFTGSAVNLTGGRTLTINNTGATVFNAPIVGGTNAITKNGPGLMVFRAINLYSGTTTVDAGTLRLAGDTGMLAYNGGAIVVNTGGVFDIDNSGTANPNRITNGAAITLNNGTLSITAPTTANRIESVGNLTITGGANTIRATSTGASLGRAQFIFTGTLTRTSPGTLNFERNSSAVPASLYLTGQTEGAVLSYATVNGSASIYSTSNGLVPQNGAANQKITVADGNDWNNGASWSPPGIPSSTDNVFVRHITTLNAPGSANSVTFDSGNGQINGTGTLTVSSSIINAGGTTTPVIGANVVLNSAEALINQSSTGLFTISGVVSGTTSLIKTGNGTLLLSNTANTYTGNTTITGGKLRVADDGSFGVVANGIILSGGTLQADSDLTIARAITAGALGGTFEVNTGATLSFTIATGLAGNTNLTKTGAGVLRFTGPSARNNGLFTVLVGSLRADQNAALGTAGTVIVENGGTLEVGDGIVLGAPPITLRDGGRVRGIGNSRINATSTVAFGATVFFEHAAVGASDVFTIGDGANDITAGSGTSVVVFAGAGRIVLPVSFGGYEGTWRIDGGLVRATAATADPFGDNIPTPSTVVLNTGGTLVVAGGNLNMPLVLNGGTLGVAAADRSFDGPVTVTQTSTITTEDQLTPLIPRDVNFTRPMSGTGGLNLIGVDNTKALRLSNASNTYSGTITVNPNTTLEAQNIGSLNGPVNLNGGRLLLKSNAAGVFNTTVQVSAASVLELNNNGLNAGLTLALSGLVLDAQPLSITGFNRFNLAVAGGTTLTANATLNLVNTGLTLQGPVTGGAVSLTQNGTGILTLQGDNTYTGTTFVNGGGLVLNGSTGSLNGGVSVSKQTSFTIDASGSVAAKDRIPDGATVAIDGGVFSLLSPAGVNRVETVGTLSVAGSSKLNLVSTTSNAQLVVSNLTSVGGGTLDFYRTFTSGQSNLFINPGAGDPTEPADGASFPFVNVYEPTLSGLGFYSRAVDNTGGVTATSPTGTGRFTFTSIASGNWDAVAGVWTRTGNGVGDPSFPDVGDDVVIAPGHTINLNGANRGAYSLTFKPTTIAQTSALAGANTLTVTSGAITVSPDGATTGTGLLGEYYNSTNFTAKVTNAAVPRVENIAQQNVGTGTDPDGAGALGTGNISMVWTGFVRPDFSENYTFAFAVDDGVRVYVNNQLLVDSWFGQGVTIPTPYVSQIPLVAGVKYPVRVEYYQGGGGSAWQLFWASASQTNGVQSIVPTSNLFPASNSIAIGCNVAIPGGTNGRIANNAMGTLSLNGTVSGSSGLEIASTGVVALNGSNTYAGGTLVRSGVVHVGTDASFSTGPATFETGTGIGGTVGAPATSVRLSNTLIANGDFAFTNSAINLILNGPLQLTGSRTITFANNNNNTAGNTGAVIVNGAITDLGNNYSFTRSGGGNLTINTPIAYGGATTLVRGVTLLGANDLLPTDRTLFMAGNNISQQFATLNLNGFSQTLPGITVLPTGITPPSNNVTSTGAGILTLNVASGSTTCAAMLTGTLQLNKIGAGVLVLANVGNNHVLPTRVMAGTLRNGLANVISDASPMIVEAGATYDSNNLAETIGGTALSTPLILNGGTVTTGVTPLAIGFFGTGEEILSTATGSLITGNISFAGAREINVAAGADLSIDAVISGVGSLNKVGSGTLVLHRVNTYSGATTVTEGTLQLNGNSATIVSSTPINLFGGTFLVDGSGGAPLANLNRIGDGVPVNFFGGSFSMSAVNGLNRTETVGLPTFAGGNSTITLTPVGAFNCQLTLTTAGAVPVNTGGTLNYVRPTATPGTANLFFTNGVDNTEVPFALVNGNASIYNGAGAAGQGLIENTPTTVITVADGDWGGALTSSAFPGGTLPASNANIIIRHAVNLTAPVTANSITFDIDSHVTGTYGITAAAAQSISVTNGVVATSGTVVPVIGTNVTTAFGAVAGLIRHNSTGQLTFNGPITGTAGLNKAGTGTMVLVNPASTFTAAVGIGQGTLMVAADTNTGADGILGPSTNVVNIFGGTYRASGTFASARTFTVTGGSTSSIDVSTGQTLTLSSALLGNNQLNVNSAAGLSGANGGTLSLAVISTRTGTTFLNGGTTLLPSSTSGTNSGLGSAVITINNAALEYSSLGVANERMPNGLAMNNGAIYRATGAMATTSGTNGQIVVAPGANISFQTGATATDVNRISLTPPAATPTLGFNQLSGGGPGTTVTFSGAGRVQFMNDNNGNLFQGAFIQNSGTVAVNYGGSLSHTTNTYTLNVGTFTTNAAITVPNPFILNGGTLGVNGAAATYSGPVSVVAPCTLTTVGLTGSTASVITLSNTVSGSAALTLLGGGSEVVLTNPASTYSGTITMGVGTPILRIQPANSPLVSGPPANINITNAATVRLRSDNFTTFSTNVLLGATGTIDVAVAGAGAGRTLTMNTLSVGTQTLNITGANTYALAFQGVTLTGTGTSAGFSPTSANLILPCVISDGGNGNGINLAVSTGTAATVTLSGTVANTYTGTTTVNNGTLVLNKTPGVNAIPGNLVVGDNTGLASVDQLKLLASNQIADTSAVTCNFVTGRIDLNGFSETIGSLADSGTPGTGSTLTTGATTGGVLTVGGNNASTIFSGAISQAGSITKVGTGTLTLGGVNTHTGGTNITAGSLRIANAASLGNGPLSITGGLLDLNALSPTVVSLSGTGGSISDTAATATTSTLTVNQAIDTAYAGTIQNGATRIVALTKTGVGTLTLSGASTFTGPTAINVGTLLASNTTGSALGTGNVTVAAGATLSGTGSVAGAITVDGIVSPGIAGVGTFTATGNITFNSGSSLAIDLVGATGDQLVVGGTMTLGANVALNATASTPTHGNSFTIVSKTGAVVVGTFNGLVENTAFPISGRPFVIRYAGGDGNDIQLIDNDVPVFTAATTNTTQNLDEVEPLATLLATDPDGDTLTFTLFSGALPAGVTLNTDGSFGGAPAFSSAGNYVVVVQATDPSGSFVRTTLNITVAAVRLSINDLTVAENVGTANLTVTRTGFGNQTVTVQATTANGTALAGSDYTTVSILVTIPAGQFTQTVAIPILDDVIAETSESFTTQLSTPTNAQIGAAGTSTVTITDNESAPALSVASISIQENVGTTQITVTLVGASSQVVSVNYATSNVVAQAGVDYSAASGSITWLPGESGPKTFNVSILDDFLDENDESFIVTLSNATGLATIGQPGVIVILDNDLPPLAVADSVTVGQGTPTTVVVLANDTNLLNTPVTASVFFGAAHGTVTANANNTFTYTSDSTYVGTDSFIYRITDSLGQTSTATVSINVIAPPKFTSAPTLTPNPALAGQIIQGTAGFQSGTITWNWGDGSPLDTSANVSHIFQTPGIYTVVATLTSPEGVQTVNQTQIFIGIPDGSGSGGGGGGGATPPGVNGILVGVGGAGKLQGGSGKLAVNYTRREKTTFSGSLGQLSLPTTLTQTALTGASGNLVVGTGVGAPAAQFPFTLGKTGKAKAAGLTSFELSVKKKRVRFTVRRQDLTAIMESLGAATQSPIDKKKVIPLLIPVTVQVGDQVYLVMTFSIKYKQSSTSSGKGKI